MANIEKTETNEGSEKSTDGSGKVMKRLYFVITCIGIGMFSGCMEPRVTNPFHPNWATTDLTTLFGSWLLTSEIAYYGASVAAADSSESLGVPGVLLTFNTDETGSTSSEDIDLSFTYSTTATEISVSFDEDIVSDVVWAYSLADNVLIITFHYAADNYDPETWVVNTFSKQ